MLQTDWKKLHVRLSRMKFLADVLEEAFEDECVTSPVQRQALLKLQIEIEAMRKALTPAEP